MDTSKNLIRAKKCWTLKFGISVLLLSLVVIGTQLYRHIDDPIRGDEAAWIFSTVYLNHYVEGDWLHPEWRHLDAIDHPPAAKYYFGIAAALTTRGSWRSIDDKQWWFESSWKIDPKKFQEGISRKVQRDVLVACRIAAAVAAFLACLGLYFLGSWLAGPIVGALGSLFFISSRLVLYYVPIVEPDFLLMAVCLWQAAFLIRWLRISGWKYAVISGILLGLAIDVKLSGFIQLPVAAMGAGWLMISRRFSQRVVLQSVVLIAVAFSTMIVLNPTLFSPLEGLTMMFRHRALQAEAISHVTGLANISPIYPMIKGWQHMFTDFGLIIDARWLPIGLFLFTVGSMTFLKRFFTSRRNDGPAWCILLMAFLWTSLSFYSFSKTLWLRYLLPASPFVVMAIGCGVVECLRAMIDFRNYRVRTIMIIGTIIFMIFCLITLVVDVERVLVGAVH